MALRALNPDQFDEVPAAPPAPAAGGKLAALNPNDFEEVAQPEKPSLLKATALGAKQGFTFGFGDEIEGALRAAFSGAGEIGPRVKYSEARDEARARDKEAQKAHPIGFGVGQILGGAATAAVPGVGAATALESLGTGFAANAARGALAGGLAAAGDSEAKDVKGLVQDTAKGGLVGGALGGILGTLAEKYVKGAPERADKTLVSDIGYRATPTQRARLANKGEDVVSVSREYGLDKVARKPSALVEATENAKNEVGSAISDIYQRADAVSPGVPLQKVTSALDKIEKEYRANPATVDIADKVGKQIENVKTTWGQLTHVPSDDVRSFATELGNKGFAGAGLDPKTTAIMQKKAWGAVKDVLADHVEGVLPGEAKRLQGLNKQYSALMDIGKAAAKREQLEKFAPTGLRQIAGENIGKLALLTGHPVGAAASLALPAAGAANRAATVALAKLARAARAGNITAKLAQEALAAGVPRGTIEAMAPGIARATMGAAP